MMCLLRPCAVFLLTDLCTDCRFILTCFMVESFLRIAWFRKGGATCVSCHDPHADDAASNPASLRFRDEPNKMCVQCHNEFQESQRLRQHTRHQPNTLGGECLSCHMPQIMDGLMTKARTHRIDDIPASRMTERSGQEDS